MRFESAGYLVEEFAFGLFVSYFCDIELVLGRGRKPREDPRPFKVFSAVNESRG